MKRRGRVQTSARTRRGRRPAELSELSVLTMPELAEWLGLSERTLYRLNPPALPVPGKRFLLRDVLAWFAARRGAA